MMLIEFSFIVLMSVNRPCARMKWSCFSNEMRLSGFLEKEVKYFQMMLLKLQSKELQVKSYS